MVQHQDTGCDADEADQQRPEPWHRAVDKHPDQLENTHGEEIQAQDHCQRHKRCARRRQHQQAEHDGGNSLKKEQPPDARMLLVWNSADCHNNLIFIAPPANADCGLLILVPVPHFRNGAAHRVGGGKLAFVAHPLLGTFCRLSCTHRRDVLAHGAGGRQRASSPMVFVGAFCGVCVCAYAGASAAPMPIARAEANT